MQFAQVIGTIFAGESSYRIVVALDFRTRIETIRVETVDHLLTLNGVADLRWTIDQYTQETIGNDLALQGWEAIAEAQSRRDDVPQEGVASVSYLVRR